MPKPSDAQSAEDIATSIRKISVFIKGMDYEGFLADSRMDDSRTYDAVIRHILIIGEAAKNLSDSAKAQYPGIDWSGLAGMRDRLIHRYSGINNELVWEVIAKELPEAMPAIVAMVAALKGTEQGKKGPGQ